MESIDPLIGLEQAPGIITSITTSVGRFKEETNPEEQRYLVRQILHLLPPNVNGLITDEYIANRETNFPETELWDLEDVNRYTEILELHMEGTYIPDTYGDILQASELLLVGMNNILDIVNSEHNPQRGILSKSQAEQLISLGNRLLEIIPGEYNVLDIENDLVTILRTGTLTEKKKILTAERLNEIQNLLILAIKKEDLYKEP